MGAVIYLRDGGGGEAGLEVLVSLLSKGGLLEGHLGRGESGEWCSHNAVSAYLLTSWRS